MIIHGIFTYQYQETVLWSNSSTHMSWSQKGFTFALSIYSIKTVALLLIHWLSVSPVFFIFSFFFSHLRPVSLSLSLSLSLSFLHSLFSLYFASPHVSSFPSASVLPKRKGQNNWTKIQRHWSSQLQLCLKPIFHASTLIHESIYKRLVSDWPRTQLSEPWFYRVMREP